jgi:polygalacturonase
MLKSEHNKHFLIQDVTFKDSPDHNLVTYSDYVQIFAPTTSHNTDGVDVYGKPAYIHDCNIDVGDDIVAVHGSDLLVENS